MQFGYGASHLVPILFAIRVTISLSKFNMMLCKNGGHDMLMLGQVSGFKIMVV